MKKFLVIMILIFSINAFATKKGNIKDSIIDDYKNFYSISNVINFSLAFGAGAVSANTNIDQSIQDFYQDEIRNVTTDDICKVNKMFGEGKIVVPLSLAMGIVGTRFSEDTKIYKFGKYNEKAFRTFLLSLPVLYSTQYLTGGSRPTERGSEWNFLNDDNGVSGHSLVGAVPFLTLANMTKNKPLKYFSYIASTFTGISRINDDKHYFSQAFLGWFVAYTASESVFSKKVKVTPVIGNENVGLNFNFDF